MTTIIIILLLVLLLGGGGGYDGYNRDGGGGRRIRAVRVEENGDAKWTEKGLRHRVEQSLGLDDVRAADKDGGRTKIGRPSREDRPVDEIAGDRGGDAGVAKEMIDVGVDGDDTVEDAGLSIDIELDQNLFLGVGHGRITESIRE